MRLNKIRDKFASEQKQAQRGQSMVEFAISLVFLLLILAGIFDGARAMFTWMALRDSAQEGVFYASVNAGDPTLLNDVTARVRQASDLLEDMGTDAIVTITFPDGQQCTAHAVTVRVELTAFPLAMPLIGTFVGSQTVPISAEATDTILLPACP